MFRDVRSIAHYRKAIYFLLLCGLVKAAGGIFLGVSEMKLGFIFTSLAIVALCVIAYLKIKRLPEEKATH